MAMMEHECTECGWMTFNNSTTSPSQCPECGGDMAHFADEGPYDYDMEEEDDLR